MLRYAKRMLAHALFEGRFGLETSDVVVLDDLNLANVQRNNYVPSSWGTMKRIARHRPIVQDDVFVDFGSGKGRMIFLAAQHPFKRVVGVELSRELHEVAERNIAANRSKLKCSDVRLINEDVLEFAIPHDMTIAYFFNPFTGELFSRVIERIAESVRQHPRRLTIVYTMPAEHDHLASQPWLETVEYIKDHVGVYEARTDYFV